MEIFVIKNNLFGEMKVLREFDKLWFDLRKVKEILGFNKIGNDICLRTAISEHNYLKMQLSADTHDKNGRRDIRIWVDVTGIKSLAERSNEKYANKLVRWCSVVVAHHIKNRLVSPIKI